MKTPMSSTAVSMLIAAVIILVCAVSFAGQKGQDNKTTSKDVKQETKEAIQTIKNYSFEQRDKAVKKVKVVLDDLDGRIDRMQRSIDKRWDEMSQSSRQKAREALKGLREQRIQLSEWYGGLKQSSASAWSHVKQGFIEGYDSLASAFEKAESEFTSDGQHKGDD